MSAAETGRESRREPANLAELARRAALEHPWRRFGLLGDAARFGDVFGRAARLAGELIERGAGPARPVALIGTNSSAWLTTWVAAQLAGAATVLLNPSLPPELVTAVLAPLDTPLVVITDPGRESPADSRNTLDLAAPASPLADPPLDVAAALGLDFPGAGSGPEAISAYLLTSGSTGPPKLVALSHRYFLSLAGYVRDILDLTATDTVFTPLPLFHINPLGYAVLGGLCAGAGVVVGARFSASGFWPEVRAEGVTAAVLHGPPLEILKRATAPADAAGHRVRTVLFCDPAFLTRFGVPHGVSVYGSTEGGGLSAAHVWRPGDTGAPVEGATRLGGRTRPGFAHRLRDEEILVGADDPRTLASGYLRPDGGLRPIVDDTGHFPTGDVGYLTEERELVFLGRRAHSIRVKGEYLPIGYLEEVFRTIPGVTEVAAWKRPSALADDELVLYLETDAEPVEEVVRLARELPGFMRPSAFGCLQRLPRDQGVGKIRLNELRPERARYFVELEPLLRIPVGPVDGGRQSAT